MPNTDRHTSVNTDDDREKDREKNKDFDHSDKGKPKGSSSKGKDLSHVPCKFFKVGSCTAGSSCPFSHHLPEPGHKDVCAWFVKGNCKFGHKCALAHILPGQSMAMDRKNKKAAQVAAVAAAGGSKDNTTKGRSLKRDHQGPMASSRNPLLSGSTAPTRPGRSPMSMPLKASISPSVPAPPLKDTDFTSLGVLDEDAKLPAAPAQAKSINQSSEPSPEQPSHNKPVPLSTSPPKSPPSPATLPVSTPSAPRRLPNATATPSIDFGPIGSPPRSAASNHANTLSRSNGFSPGTSPSRDPLGTNILSTSPFSAPGAQAMFIPYGEASQGGVGLHGTMAASLGSGLAMQGRAWNTEYRPISTQIMGRSVSTAGHFDIGFEYDEHQRRTMAGAKGTDVAVEDEDLEDFIPSSLTDLLTQEERNRRMSRSNSGQGPSAVGKDQSQDAGTNLVGGPSANGHRYSHSVPAPSLLSDIKSIWADSTTQGLPSSPSRVGALGNGMPSSFKSPLQSNLGGHTLDALPDDIISPSPSMLSPTNASAAFLPGLHHHYMNAKAKQVTTGLGRGLRTTSNPLQPAAGNSTLNPGTAIVGSYHPTSSAALSSSPSHVSTFARPNVFNTTHTMSNAPTNTSLPIPSQNLNGEAEVLSPSARALQAHAPGQSLPQGLAAGYSRIHALPPLPSPGTLSASPGMVINGAAEWGAMSPPATSTKVPSTLSYSAAAARTMPPATPPGLGRNISNKGMSPLSGQVLNSNADEIFDMEG